MKKSERNLLIGGLILAALVLFKPEPVAQEQMPLIEPEPEPKKPADMPNSVSGRYPLRNYKTA